MGDHRRASRDDSGFQGTIGRTWQESTPWWPQIVQPPPGSPNVVVVLLDDTGYGSLGCYGSEIETPNIDSLAARGLVYTRFHTTSLCSPTRASLLTGRDHHAVGMSIIANADSGFPSKRGAVSNRAGMLSEMLRDAGYNTFAVGKWHLAPADQTSAAGPFDQWPLGRGFEQYYGFLDAVTDQFQPELVHDNHRVDPPRTPEQGYTLNEDLVDHAMQYLTDQVSLAPDRPFFLYFATGATHSPHEAPPAFREKYRGRYDAGWDVIRERRLAKQKALGIVPPNTELTPRNPGVEPWNSLSSDQKRLYARFQEAFAAFLDHTDHEIGRLIRHLERLGRMENTIFVFASDNGASQEGQLHGSTSTTFYENGDAETLEYNLARIDLIGTQHARNNYPVGWAQAGNTPLKRYKQNTHAGGILDPLIVTWPAGIAKPGLRHQFHHAMDIVPTILEALDIEAPAEIRGVPQMPMHGTSMSYTFDGAGPTRKRTQIFEMFGHRGIWHDGWKAVAYHPRYAAYEDDVWELYYVADDVAENRDLAETHPEKLAKLIELWWSEAGRYDVLPLDDRGFAERRAASRRRPDSPRMRSRYVYYGGIGHVPSGATPFILDRSYSIAADLTLRPGGEGVIIACGGVCGGYSLYVKDGKVAHDYNYYQHIYRVEAELHPAGKPQRITYAFTKTGPLAGIGKLYVDDVLVSQTDIAETSRFFMDWEGLDVGRDGLSPASPAYHGRGEFRFTGEIDRVTIDLGDDIEGVGDFEPSD
jgi:arylsulfatase A-like enzyme